MSWVEVLKINSNLKKTIDNLILEKININKEYIKSINNINIEILKNFGENN